MTVAAISRDRLAHMDVFGFIFKFSCVAHAVAIHKVFLKHCS